MGFCRRSAAFLFASQLKEQRGSSPRGPAVGGGVKQNCGVVFVHSGTVFQLFFLGREGGESTVDESQFDTAVASAGQSCWVPEVRGVRGRYVLTSYHISDKSALLSLQTSRKCNKAEGCVLSARSAEERQKGRCPMLPACWRRPSRKVRQTMPSKPRPRAKISLRHPSWALLGFCKKGLRGREKA